jgi:hypothetical protein
MKWNDNDIEKLIDLVNQGLKPNRIAEIFGVTYKTITNKMFRLGLQVVYTTNKTCKNCGNTFESYLSKNKLFCNSSCSTTFNNKKRKHSEETKNKISKTLKSKPTKPTNPTKPKVGKIKTCRICNNKVIEKYKIVCTNCRLEYYQYYRPSCTFQFNVKDYPQEFDLILIEQYGWYSPTNKKNNLVGVTKDHKYSVMEGYRNKIDPNILSHPANCELLLFSDNSSKNGKSSLTLSELLENIEIWNKKYGNI